MYTVSDRNGGFPNIGSRRSFFLLILIFLPVFFIVPSASGAELLPGKTALAKSLQKAIEYVGVPGAVLALKPIGGQTVFVSAGLAEIREQETDNQLLSSLTKKGSETEGLIPESLLSTLCDATIIRGRPMAKDLKFRVASMEKAFVAATVVILAEEGRLSLDDPVDRWVNVSGLPLQGVRIRHLLGHRSGLPNYTEHPRFYPDLLDNPQKKWRPSELLKYAGYRKPYFPPGADARYSNTNYVLLAMILQKATGRTYTEAVQKRIITPLNLRNTFFPTGPKVSDDFSHGYRHDFKAGGRWRDYSEFVDPSWAWGQGTLVSNAQDLATFMAALLDGRLPGKGLSREMTDFGPRSGSGPEYGLGLKNWHGAVGHDGDYVFGYQSLMVRSRGLDWIVLVNGQPTRPGLLNGPMAIWRQVMVDLGL